MFRLPLYIFLSVLFAGLELQAMTTNTILGGVIGNADFEDGEPALTNEVTHANTAFWFNASGAETENFTRDTQTAGSSQSNSRAGMPFQNRTQVNSRGHTVTSIGEVFTLRYDFGRVGGGWDGDEQMRTFLFTADATVDGNLTTGNITEVDSLTYTFPTSPSWSSFSTNSFYVTDASDIGKTLYFGMLHLNPAGNNTFPRIDVIELEVIVPTTPVTNTSSTILGGTLGNADFENGEPGASNAVTYSNTLHWFNADGAESLNFTQDTNTSGSSQPNSRAGMPFNNRKQVNNVGYTVVSTGEVFNLSYDFGRTGNNWDGDESMRTFLFTASTTVDDDLTDGNMMEFASVTYAAPTNTAWTSFSTNAFYVTTASDIGKTFYFGMNHVNPAGSSVFPRIDVISLVVTNGGSGGVVVTNPPVLNAWQEYVAQHGLSGDLFSDQDSDGQQDFYEFAHGGNPTNDQVIGSLPYLEYGTNDVVSYHSVEATHSNVGVYYSAEWSEDLIHGPWNRAWDLTNATPAALPNYSDMERQYGLVDEERLYVRNRVSTSPHEPNILFILADDLGYADVGFNNSPDIITPELDALANAGTIFSSAYVVHPFCGPSRMGLLAGRYPHEFGGPFNMPDWNQDAYREEGISTNETLFSSILQDAGYYTGLMGKWHLGYAPEFHPNVRGFDEFYGFLGGGKNYFGPYIPLGNNTFSYNAYPEYNGVYDTSLTASDYITDVLTDKGVEFINTASTNNQPFFLFMSYNAPHTPLEAKASDMAVFPSLTGDRLTYAGMVYALDRGVGALVDALEATGQMDNTLIIFLSDNGGRTDRGANNSPLRGTKGDAWEGGSRVPMLMHWPNVVQAGVTNDHPISALDFYPTFSRLSRAVIPATKELDGKDVWDAIASDTSARSGESIYTMRYRIGYGATGITDVAIRRDQWKASRVAGSWQLFNIDNDIHEDTDLSASNPSVLSNMVYEAELWSQEHITPTIYDSTQAEADWISRGMPHYDATFTIP